MNGCPGTITGWAWSKNYNIMLTSNPLMCGEPCSGVIESLSDLLGFIMRSVKLDSHYYILNNYIKDFEF